MVIAADALSLQIVFPSFKQLSHSQSRIQVWKAKNDCSSANCILHKVNIRKIRIFFSDNIITLSIKIMQKTLYNRVLYIYLSYLRKKGEVTDEI